MITCSNFKRTGKKQGQRFLLLRKKFFSLIVFATGSLEVNIQGLFARSSSYFCFFFYYNVKDAENKLDSYE